MPDMTVTLYSRGPARPSPTWQGTVLEGVYHRPRRAGSLTPGGPEPEHRGDLLLIPARGGRRSREEYGAAKEKLGLFTLLPGDYVAAGAQNIGPFVGELRSYIPSARPISAVTDRIYGTAMDHWEVETE